MPYLNLDLDYFDHPKTRRLIGLLGRGAEVLPLRLWSYCGKFHSDDGSLAGYSPQEIESIVQWWGKAGEATAALLDVGTLEPDVDGYRVHGWTEHQGHIKALRERAVKAARARWNKLNKPELIPPDAPGMRGAVHGQCLSNAPALSLKPSEPAIPFLKEPLTVEPLNGASTQVSVQGVQGSAVQGDFVRMFREGWEPGTEGEFIALLNEATEDMGNFGGRWRKRWREDRDKCLRALRDFREASKSRIIATPGGYLNDLFDRRLA